jgi:phage/plasmid-associated DNA primase
MERDLSKYTYSFQPSRPITDSYKEAQKSSIKPLNRFVSALVNSNVLTGKKMSSAELYRVFKEWCLSESYKHVITSIAFGRDLNRIKGVGSSKSTGCMHYSFNVKMVKQDLEEQNEYDEGAYLPDRLAHELGGS